jgi:ABC-type multidrug transport system fused ATPase/permease subunit
VFFAVILSGIGLGQAGPIVGVFSTSLSAAYRVFQVRARARTRLPQPRPASGCETGGIVACAWRGVLCGWLKKLQCPRVYRGTDPATLCVHHPAPQRIQIIDTKPAIDSQSTAGVRLTPADVRGRIEFKNVTFAYPTRPDTLILQDFSLTIEPGVCVCAMSVLYCVMLCVCRASCVRAAFCCCCFLGGGLAGAVSAVGQVKLACAGALAEGVSYPHPPPHRVARCLMGPAGETVAFVGPSGSGKSTICSLIQKQYQPLVRARRWRSHPHPLQAGCTT